jgi:hypothetical protein
VERSFAWTNLSPQLSFRVRFYLSHKHLRYLSVCFPIAFFPLFVRVSPTDREEEKKKFSSQGGIHSMMMTIEITIARSHLYQPTDFLFSSLSRRF